jgi:hypothetical protein
MHADIKPDNILVRLLDLRATEFILPSDTLSRASHHRSTSRRHS